MALYELLLLGQGRPELRLTDCVLALGDLVEVADQRWRVQRMSPPSGEDVELRYVLILEAPEVLGGEAQPARRQPRELKADFADARDKSGVLRDAASRVRAQAQRVGNEADRSPRSGICARAGVGLGRITKGDATGMDWLMEDRIGRNQATFRAANERIGAAAGVYDIRTPVPFICECADPNCSNVVRLELDQYEEIRSDSRRFLNVPGHQTAAQGVSVVVEERNGYVIVEKLGHAGEVAEALDERNTAEDLAQAASEE